MYFDFDKENNRRGTGSLKWDVSENELPMWVADMDFETLPEIREAIKKRVDHGIFGYSVITDEWYDAYIGWWHRRYGFDIKKEWLIFCTGIVPAISSMVRKLTCPAENVIIISPTFNLFFNSTYNNGRNIVECPLKYENGKYSFDFSDLEEKCKNPQSTLLILCNPQNPSGNIWTKEELSKIGEICYRNHVIVISDEIHCDLTLPGRKYTPFASISEICEQNSVTCIAPTKAFNIAGIQTAAVVVPNDVIRHKVWRGLNTDEIAEGNVFAVDATVAAFNYGETWLNELNEYIANNRRFAEEFIDRSIPKLHVVKGEATYLLWVDCMETGISSDVLVEMIRKETGLFLSEGCEYRGNGAGFFRMNLACPKSRLEDGLSRLKQGIEIIVG